MGNNVPMLLEEGEVVEIREPVAPSPINKIQPNQIFATGKPINDSVKDSVQDSDVQNLID